MTTAVLTEPQSGFQSLSLSPSILAALQRVNYHTPTPIQAALIPEALAGRDVIGQAQTGTGKTAAFLLPFLNRWRESDEAGAAGPRACAHARTGRPGRGGSEQARSPSPDCRAVAVYGGQPCPPAAQRHPPRVRHRGRHARPCARPSRSRHAVAGERPLRRPRRGRPDARHRFPAGHRKNPAAVPAPRGRRCSCRPRCPGRCCAWPSATCRTR